MTKKYHLKHSLKAGESNIASKNVRNLQCNIERDRDKKEVMKRQD